MPQVILVTDNTNLLYIIKKNFFSRIFLFLIKEIAAKKKGYRKSATHRPIYKFKIRGCPAPAPIYRDVPPISAIFCHFYRTTAPRIKRLGFIHITFLFFYIQTVNTRLFYNIFANSHSKFILYFF